MNLFNAAELLDIGIEKEKVRRDFYCLVAEQFDETEMKNLFKKLEKWEETHIDTFTEIRTSIKEEEGRQSYEGELTGYIDALVDDNLYTQITPENFKSMVSSPMDAIQYSIGFEKDAILFFNEFLAYTPGVNKAVVQKLINEEKKHLVYLNALKNKLMGQS